MSFGMGGGRGSGWDLLGSLRREGDLAGRRVGAATARRVASFARPYRRHITVFLGTVVLGAGIGVATPVLAGQVINALSPVREGAGGTVVRLALMIAGLAVVDAAINDTAAGRLVLSDAGVVALATALGIGEVRAAALQHCLGPRAAAAEQLWAALARETPDPEAAEPATLLAVSALLRGDGALANIALDRAERAWPGHAFSTLVRGAAEAGLRPSLVRALLRDRAPADGDQRATR
jgi:hypothetical protein